MLKLPHICLLRAWVQCIVLLVLFAIVPAYGGPTHSQASEDSHPRIKESIDARTGGRAEKPLGSRLNIRRMSLSLAG